MKSALAYIRISDDEQSHFSIEGQIRTITEYCERSGIVLFRNFVDNGYSAKNFDRPAWKELKDHLKRNKGQHSYLIVYKYDRMIRNAMEGLAMIQELEKTHKLTIISVCENLGLNPHSPYFKKVRADILVNAEFERDVISHRVRFGMNAATRSGRYLHQAPIGYLNSRDDDNKPILVIDHQTSKIVINIFESYAAGRLIGDVLRQAKESGFKHSGHSSIRKVLRNPLYGGLVRTTSFEGNPEKLVTGIHEPLITPDMWWYVQSKLDQGSKMMAPKITSDNLPLRGIIQCTNGHLLTGCMCTGKSGRKWPYYKCNKCRQSHSAIKAHESILKIFTSLSLNDTMQEILMQRIQAKIDAVESNQDRERKKLQKEINDVRHLINSCEDKYLRDAISADTYNRQMQRLNSQLDHMTRQLNDIKSIEFPDDLHNVIAKLSALDNVFNQATTVQKQQMIRIIFPQGLILEKNSYQTPKLNYILKHNPDITTVLKITGAPADPGTPLSGPQGREIKLLFDFIQSLSA